MTNAELIQKIKAEIERLIEESNFDESANLYSLLSFLSTLEEPVCEELEAEIQNMLEQYIKFTEGRLMMLKPSGLEKIARHFAQWQKEQDEKELSEKIASAYQLGLADKENQMLKEAVDAKIYGYDDGSYELIASWLDLPKGIYKDGDKVRIIICKKEDGE